jgi:thiol-disulfide isomerase/thioredoxin
LYCLLSFMLTVSVNSIAQEYTLSAHVEGIPVSQVYLVSIYRFKQTIIDSASSGENGNFQFHFNRGSATGLYRLILGKTKKSELNNGQPQTFNIIFNKENTDVFTVFDYPADSMKVSQGKENQLYYEYLKKKRSNTQRLELLEQLLRQYPDDDCVPAPSKKDPPCFYHQIEAQYSSLQMDLLNYTHDLVERYPGTFISKIVRAEQFPFLDVSLNEEARLQFMKSNFFKPSDFQDTLLLRSDVLSNKIVTYIGLYRNTSYNETQQSRAFIQGSDMILTMARAGDPGVFDYTLTYVMEGFNQIKQDEVLASITDNYVSGRSCGIEDENLKRIILKTANYKRSSIGATAPEILFTVEPKNSAGRPVILSDIKAEYTLLLFWASWCPHCNQLLPELKKVYDRYKGSRFEVVAVSLDVDSLQYTKTISTGNYSWVNSCDYRKWESPPAREYNVHATPTMFLLDRTKKIIAKPEKFEQVIPYLAQ